MWDFNRSMRKSKVIVTRTAGELAKEFGLSPVDGAEIELRSALNSDKPKAKGCDTRQQTD